MASYKAFFINLKNIKLTVKKNNKIKINFIIMVLIIK